MMESPQQSTSGRGSLQNARFESIDIQPEFRIPSPQPPLWLRFWQPIGTTVMDTRVVQEPRGFMRILELLFAVVAFATLANFSTQSEYKVMCSNNNEVQNVRYEFSYPFRLDHQQQTNVTCPSISGTPVTSTVYPPGDFSSDAQFFVFTGVISFLICIGSLVVYVMFSSLYSSEQKSVPLVDFCVTVVTAVLWLSASAALANGVINMKYLGDPANWIYATSHFNNSICMKNSNGTYKNTWIKVCEITDTGRFSGADVAVIIGFLNFFLWTSNLWFVYKETTWFAGSPAQPHSAQPGT